MTSETVEPSNPHKAAPNGLAGRTPESDSVKGVEVVTTAMTAGGRNMNVPMLPSHAALRYAIRNRLAWLRVQSSRWALWKWRFGRLPRRADWPFDIFHIGRKDQRDWFAGRWGLDPQHDAGPPPEKEARAWVCDFPVPGAFCIPRLVSTVVPLDRPLEKFVAAMDSELRRRIRKQRPLCRIVQATSSTDIAFAESQMLRPYATARRGDGAVQLREDEVQRIAEIGRLDIVYLNDEPVSCNLGSPIVRGGKTYWSALRYGFTEAVFSDRKRWGEINALNNFVVLEWALAQGYDYYDIGYAVAQPDDGLLQWKKRQGGALGTMHNHEYDYVSFPVFARAKIFWESPIFSIEHGEVTLHLGVPDMESDESVLKRYRHMGFDGLGKVSLHCANQPGSSLLAGIQKLYDHLKKPPPVEARAYRASQ